MSQIEWFWWLFLFWEQLEENWFKLPEANFHETSIGANRILVELTVSEVYAKKDIKRISKKVFFSNATF